MKSQYVKRKRKKEKKGSVIINIKMYQNIYLNKEQIIPLVMEKSMQEFHYELFASAIMHGNKVNRCAIQ